MTTATDTKVPDQFKKAAKHVRDTVEGLLEPYEGKRLAAAQKAVAHVHRTGKPATAGEWRARYEAAIAEAVAE